NEHKGKTDWKANDRFGLNAKDTFFPTTGMSIGTGSLYKHKACQNEKANTFIEPMYLCILSCTASWLTCRIQADGSE
ncbi:MAG: hypothetical protein NC080_00005, partial [Paraprevotella sp.]|nr:hypothetical protein [Paraprevotella sp.]